MKRYNEKGCSVTDDWTYKNMKVLFIENDFLRIGILVGKGSDIFEFRYKPYDLDPLLRLPKGIRNPATDFSQIHNPSGRFADYYYGGWQETLPNSPAFNYRGAVLGQHGELSLTPWKYAILKDTADEVVVKLWVELLRMPLLLEKTLTLKKDEATLYISEALTNCGKVALDIMWGHHIAFGLPFLKAGAVIETNAQTFTAEDATPLPRRFKPGSEFTWPNGETIAGLPDDARMIPPVEANPYSDLCYLKGYDTDAFYSIRSKESDLSFKLTWDGDIYKCLWLWEERLATADFPWWGQCYTVALEPWTSAWTNDPQKAIDNGEWLKIQAGEVITSKLTAGIHPV